MTTGGSAWIVIHTSNELALHAKSALDSTKGITILLADQDFPFGVNTRDIGISRMIITFQSLVIVVELILKPFLQDF